MTRLWKMTMVGAVALMTASGCKGSLKINAGDEQEEPPPPPPPPPPAKPKPAPVAAAPMKDPEGIKVTDDHLEIDQKIQFGTDSDVIQEESFGLLDAVATALNNHKEFSSVEVIGHTDSRGDDAHNKDLSGRRAASVVKALESRGVKQELKARGAGEDEPLCEEQTPECHEMNRRVEFKLSKRGG